MTKPLVSIIIPTRNESKVIARNLSSVQNQNYSNFETIVVDDGSQDDTVSIAKEFTSKVYPRAHAERSVQRNFGVQHSKGKYLLFLDADMEVTENVISDCVEKSENNPQIGAIAIPENPVADNFWEKVKAFERSFYSQEGDKDTDAARFFSRTAFLEAGGYDESLIGPEDWDLPETIAKLDYKIDRVMSRIFHHERASSLFKLGKKKFYYALTSHKYFAKHNISAFGPKSVYLLRPIFYKNWRTLVKHPLLTLGMFIVLTTEQFFGLFGYIVGRVTNK